ncbi:MAG: response regulator [Bacteroidota bacterium]
MRIRDIRIGTQLSVALIVTVLLVLVLATLAFEQAQKLWETTANIQRHPLAVQIALGRIKSDMWEMRNGIKVMFLSKSEEQRTEVSHTIAIADADVEIQLKVLYDRYLGKAEDVDNIYHNLQTWRVVRNETIQLLREGRVEEARLRLLPDGPDGKIGINVINSLGTLTNFAENKAASFFREATAARDTLLQRFFIVVLTILLLSVLIGVTLFRSLRPPLIVMTKAANLFSNGNFDTRIDYQSKNELGSLASSLNILADTVQNEIEQRDSIQRISEAIVSENSIPSFVNSLLMSMSASTEALFAAFYLHEPDTDTLVLSASLGLSADVQNTYSISKHEGPFALALETLRIHRVTEIPADTIFLHPTVAGGIVPREIAVIPIVSGRTVLAMIVLGSLRPFSAKAIHVLTNTRSFIAARLSSLLATEKIKVYSDALQIQNRELESLSGELSRQTDELTSQNMELSQQKRQLDEANKMKSSFLSNMSHELRTPLNSVIALSNVLKRRLDGSIPKEEHGYLEIIERNGSHLLSLINDILDLSRIEAGHEEITFSQTKIQTIVGEVVGMLGPHAREKGLELSSKIDVEFPTISTDTSKCRQVLINLIGNAVKFTDEGSIEISAAATVAGDFVEIVVSDSGVGIAPEHLDAVFQEFKQVDDSTTRKHGGTGLGLAISKRYAKLLGGDITVESTPGKGSRFIFRLPLVLDESTASSKETYLSAATPKASLPAASFKGKTILIVEDSEPAVLQMRDVLQAEGFEVLVASNGSEALRKIAEKIPDAMILDLMMPEIDGFEVLRIVREQAATAALPVLILTAKRITKDELAFLRGNNVKQLIQKGDVSRKELLTAVTNMLGIHPPAAIINRIPRRPKNGDKPRILVIEDNPDNMTTAAALLADSCTVLQASDGRSGLHIARDERPDVILLDISLPGIDGFTVLEYARQDSAIKHIPVIALTSRAMQGDVEEILSHGFDGYISKPIDAELFEQQIFGTPHGDA